MTTDLLALIEEVDALRRSRDDAWQIPRAEGQFLYQFALASNAQTIVEVGTSYGFSGLFWGAAAKQTGGVLHTIDINPAKVEMARKHFHRAGLEKSIVSHLGDAMTVLPTLKAPFDIVFLDGQHKTHTRQYFEIIWPWVRVGGSVFTDNVTTHPDELADFMTFARGRQDAASSPVPIGNGVEWTVKTK